MLTRTLQVLLKNSPNKRKYINQPTFNNLHISFAKTFKVKNKKQILVNCYGVYIRTIIGYIGWLFIRKYK